MSGSVSGEMVKILRKHGDIESVLNDAGRMRCVIYLNPETYRAHRSAPEHLEKVTAVTFDGFLMSWLVGRFLLRDSAVRRQSFDFTSIADEVFTSCERRGQRLFVAGGTGAEVGKFVRVLRARYPSLCISDWCDGFRDTEELLKRMADARTNVAVLGLGSVRQDIIAARMSSASNVACFTCGAFITQTALGDTDHFYPRVVRRYGGRWLYRIWKQPRILRRLILQYPIGVAFILWDIAIVRMSAIPDE